MRLIDLDPRWAGGNYWRDGVEYAPGRSGDPAFQDGRHGLGLTFDCPVHGEGCHLGGGPFIDLSVFPPKEPA